MVYVGKSKNKWIYAQWIHYIVQKKLTQHCKSTIFQYKVTTTTKALVCRLLLLLMLLSCFSRVRLCVTPQTAAHQAPRPWDSPGKNTGVGCHFLLQCRKVKSEREVTQSCPTGRNPMDCSLPGSSAHGVFQARVLEWVPFPSPGMQARYVKSPLSEIPKRNRFLYFKNLALEQSRETPSKCFLCYNRTLSSDDFHEPLNFS